jgi:hypothetical protein
VAKPVVTIDLRLSAITTCGTVLHFEHGAVNWFPALPARPFLLPDKDSVQNLPLSVQQTLIR